MISFLTEKLKRDKEIEKEKMERTEKKKMKQKMKEEARRDHERHKRSRSRSGSRESRGKYSNHHRDQFFFDQLDHVVAKHNFHLQQWSFSRCKLSDHQRNLRAEA